MPSKAKNKANGPAAKMINAPVQPLPEPTDGPLTDDSEPSRPPENERVGTVNRKKQKRRAKEAAKRAASQAADPRHGMDEALDRLVRDESSYRYDQPGRQNGWTEDTEDSKKSKRRPSDYSSVNGETMIPRLGSAPPLPSLLGSGSSAVGAAASRGSHKDRIWNTSTAEERERIKEFWLSLGEGERRGLVRIEKEAVLKKMKEQQKHSCSCTVCGRKRTAIEEELEVLYDAYYEELENYANHQQFGLDVSTMPPPRMYDRPRPPSLSYQYRDQSARRLMDRTPKPDPTPEDEFYGEEDDADDLSEEELGRSINATGGIFNFGNSLTAKGGILTVADDLLKNDGKKFIDMMEQLAERRMQREEEAHMVASGMGHPSMREQPLEDEEEDLEEDSYDEEDEDDFNSEEEDDFEDDELAMTEEQRMEEGRRMFQIFAARMFEQRVLTAYREKVSSERQAKLIEEMLEDEELDAQRQAKKAKDAQKKREKRQKQKQAKDEERAKREAMKAAEEAEAKAAEERRLEDQRQKREEQRRKREAEKLAAEIAKKRKEEEKQRKEQEKKKSRPIPPPPPTQAPLKPASKPPQENPPPVMPVTPAVTPCPNAQASPRLPPAVPKALTSGRGAPRPRDDVEPGPRTRSRKSSLPTMVPRSSHEENQRPTLPHGPPPGLHTQRPPSQPIGAPFHSRGPSASSNVSPRDDRPAPIRRPSSRQPNADVDDLSNHLGSSALIDDTEEAPEPPFRSSRISSNPVGAPRLGRQPFGSTAGLAPIGTAFRAEEGWAAPPFSTLPRSAQPFSTGPGFGRSGPNGASYGWPAARRARIRTLVSATCYDMTAFAPNSQGFHPVEQVLREVCGMMSVSEAALNMADLLAICDTEGTAANGGGWFEVKGHEKAGLLLKHHRIEPEPLRGNSRSPGDIGSPINGPMGGNIGGSAIPPIGTFPLASQSGPFSSSVRY